MPWPARGCCSCARGRAGCRRFSGLRCWLTSAPRSLALQPAQSGIPDTTQTTRGKLDHLHRTPAEFTTPTLDGSGLRNQLLARPAGQASYPVVVHRVAALLHASFGPRLAAMPLRFASPSTPSVWAEDPHLQAVEHARHTTNRDACRQASLHVPKHSQSDHMVGATKGSLRAGGKSGTGSTRTALPIANATLRLDSIRL